MFGGDKMLSSEAENYIQKRGVNRGRVVLHSDLNNFFASVECLKHRALKSYPVAVCGSIEDRHGIVLAKNNLAKAFGIKTGQVIWQAKRLCPELIVLEPHYEDYAEYSDIIRQIYHTYSDRVEPFGMDEAWIELTGGNGIENLYDGVRTANSIRKKIYEETGLTVSVGVSDNKTFSKLASDYKKPDAVTLFGPDEYLSIISRLSIGEMMYAGRSTQKRLNSFSINTIGDAARSSVALFRSILGKNGVSLYYNACGYDTSPVIKIDAEDIIKSIGNSATPPRDLCNSDDVKIMLYALCDKVSSRLRKAGMRATVLQIHIRDTNLNVAERQCCILPTDNQVQLAKQALALYESCFGQEVKMRSIGVRTSGLVKNSAICQESMFGISFETEEKNKVIDSTVDELRLRFGRNIIKRGILHTDKSLYSPIYSPKHMIQPFKSH